MARLTNGGLVGKITTTPTATSAVGKWNTSDQFIYKYQNLWTGGINQSGIVLNLDAANILSYPGTGNTWYDLSPSGLNATGGSSITGQALQANQPYNTVSTSILNTDTHSLFFSIQINNTTGTWDKIFGYTPSGTDRSPGIWRYPSSARIHWRYDGGNSGADFDVTTVGGYNEPTGTQFQANVWYYVGVTKNGATATSYVNGLKLGTSSVTNPKTAGNSTIQLYPGYTGSSKMRHVHAYNRVLSDAEVLANYNIISTQLV